MLQSTNRVLNRDPNDRRRFFFVKGQLQREYKLLTYERALKMLKNDTYIAAIGQAVLEIFYFKVDIPRKSLRIRISLKVSIKSGDQ